MLYQCYKRVLWPLSVYKILSYQPWICVASSRDKGRLSNEHESPLPGVSNPHWAPRKLLSDLHNPSEKEYVPLRDKGLKPNVFRVSQIEHLLCAHHWAGSWVKEKKPRPSIPCQRTHIVSWAADRVDGYSPAWREPWEGNAGTQGKACGSAWGCQGKGRIRVKENFLVEVMADLSVEEWG